MANIQVQKVEGNLQIKASAEQFYDVLCSRTHQIAKMCPEIHSVQILKGEWGSEGSIISWSFIHGGKVSVSKEMLEGIDRENKKVIYKTTEGDLSKHYKSLNWILQVTPQEKGSVVTWTLEYEKQSEDAPEAHSLLDLALKMSKDIDAHLTN